ncbi:uncharacterized protein [Atheta coriaria]|uniref:uncharacterized protein n=1 Tax=Dalotia coriaria TaxID=877792 RepID=UPI0031F3939E
MQSRHVRDYSLNHLFVICLLGQFLLTHCESEHRTKAAAEKHPDLYCYKCDNIDGDDACLNVNNVTTYKEKCEKEHRICQVRTITMSSQENKTAPAKLWLVKRACTKVCEPVCVTIGERTKLRACNTCCETDLCNRGNSASRHVVHMALLLLVFLGVALLKSFIQTTRYN